jgi:hypothetical protein
MLIKCEKDLRHRMLARTLHARIYIDSAARILLASGKIEFRVLAKTLGGVTAARPLEKAPPLSLLGLATSSGELTNAMLHRIGLALNRWRLELDAEAKLRPAKRRRREAIESEIAEVDRLEQRLQSLREYQTQIRSGKTPTTAPFFLDPDSEAEFRKIVRSKNSAELPNLLLWQARIVYWLSGARALERYLRVIPTITDAYPETSSAGQLRRFQKAVELIKARAGTESLSNLLAELAHHQRNLPSELIRRGRFSVRLKGKTLTELCDVLTQSCAELLLETQAEKCSKLPGAIAALTAADGASEHLPLRPFEEAARLENFPRLMRIVHALGDLIGKPGYGQLLCVIDKFKQVPNEQEFASYQQFLGGGRSQADLLWATEHTSLKDILVSNLRIAELRQLWHGFQERGFPMEAAEMQRIVTVIRSGASLNPFRVWLRWLGSVSPRLVTLLWEKTLRPAFWENFLLAAENADWFESLAPILKSVPRTKTGDPRRLIEQVETLQATLGRNERLPKSLRRILEHCDRREQEIAALESMKERGVITASANARLEWLASQQRREVRDSKLLRTAEEVFITLGVEAQTQVLRQIFLNRCQAALGDLVNHLDIPLLREVASWVESMNSNERILLKNLTHARAKFGESYRRHLADNQDWIRKAERHGLRLDAWFSVAPHHLECQDEALCIARSGDLYDLFMMGEYFQTCLSLDGINHEAILTNAYDANKQVLFVTLRNESGKKHVIARKLLVVNADFKLIGYNIYVRSLARTEAMHNEITNAVNAYCGRLAAQCGLQLASEGAPEPIGDHFWYDDGVCEWPKTATDARNEWQAQNAPPLMAPLPIDTGFISKMPYALIAMQR